MLAIYPAAGAHQPEIAMTTSPEKSSRPASGGSTEARECALLARIASQDGAAMKELYLLYHRRLARFLMRLTTRYELAEEIINDTFWVIWQHAADFRGASRVSTWIMGIAYRRGLKTLRYAGPPPPDGDLVAEIGTDEPARQEEINEWLDVALQRLPLEQRMVIELAYHVGHSCEEIAAIMQCPVNTVKTRMFHARRKLKTLLTHLAGPA
ncbi:MAG TPA: sigma-70 family RNA polymerase sigma factor [Steroidobacteraceae bacterium]|nr:sigma-70 family RNA polymerase sigma factor [Steroidobacteraceae bacterium]